MEKRLLLAVVLMTAAILITNLLFPPPEPPAPAEDGERVEEVVQPAPDAERLAAPLPVVGAPADVAVDTVVVESPLYRHVLTTDGAVFREVELLAYPSYAREGLPVQLVQAETVDFLAHRVVVGQDTVDLRQVSFQASETSLRVDEESGPRVLTLTYGDRESFGVELEYTFAPDRYLISARGQVHGLGGRAARILTEIGPGLEVHEHPDHHSVREFAVVTRIPGSVDRMPMRRVEGRRLVDSQLTWAGIKDKYFLAALIAGEETPLAGAVLQELPEVERRVNGDDLVLPRAQVSTILPVRADGTFSFDVYLGPQDYSILRGIGYDLEDVTPYGYRWLQPVIRPLVAAVLWVLNTLHDTLGLAYGWVLVVFGVMMRIVLWPLNAKAMRAQMRNMGAQPLLQEIREKYKDDPQKQQEAMVSLYKEHGFNPFAGCLPMLVPFPVLITLFFVFQNTIAFRGAEFLWLPDLSLRDPLYILPLSLVVSMFALQWVSMHLSGMEQNPQMKMMLYFMPLMMGVIFFMFPAGLNLYYVVTQVASLPQQILIAKERKRAQEDMKKSGDSKLSPPTGGGGRRKRKAKR
jgi:YidC/Oxa1 family membrane protein insertase